MKKTILSIAVAVGLLGLSAVKAQAAFVSTNLMAIQVSVTLLALNTNSLTPVTNATTGIVTQTYKSTPVVITTADILKMLEVEHSTTFPAGAKLAIFGTGGNGFRVTDANANILLDVSANFSISNSVVTGESESTSIIGKTITNPANTNIAQTFALYNSDSGFFYNDSHGNHFHVVGVRTTKVSATSKPATGTVIPTASITITGSGGGTAFSIKTGKQETGVITRGLMLAVGKNLRS